MIKGGYKIIDFKGVELSTTAVEITGIYNQIIDDYNKPIMVSGVSISGELQDDAYASVKVDDSSVTLTIYGGVITVTEDDEVTFAVAKSNVELAAEIEELKLKAFCLTSNEAVTTDVNDAVRGYAVYSAGAPNLPTAAVYLVMTFYRSTGVKFQFALNRAVNVLYTRTYDGIWSAWRQATNVDV